LRRPFFLELRDYEFCTKPLLASLLRAGGIVAFWLEKVRTSARATYDWLSWLWHLGVDGLKTFTSNPPPVTAAQDFDFGLFSMENQ